MVSLQNMLMIIGLGILKFVIGALWYGLIFSKPWIAGMQEGGKTISGDPKKAFLGNFTGGLVTSAVLCYLIDQLAITSLVNGALLGFLVWLGFILATNIDEVLFEKRNMKLFLLTNGYQLVSLVIMGAIYGMWY